MSTHATTERLSAYLDRQLPTAESREVEDHLADCPVCRQRFAGMRNVVASLRHLERMAPPPTLGGLVARMPLTFLALLLGIISLAGLPPMSGFVSKWMVYTALLQDSRPLLFVASVVGSIAYYFSAL